MLLKHMQHENVSTPFSPFLMKQGGFLATQEQVLFGGITFILIERS